MKTVCIGVEPRKIPIQRRVDECLFHRLITEDGPVLHEVDAQHCLDGEGRPASLGVRGMRLDLPEVLRRVVSFFLTSRLSMTAGLVTRLRIYC